MSSYVDPVAALRRIAFLLERQLADSYRIKAYRGAAATLLGVDRDEIVERSEAGTLRELPGIGAKTAAIVDECVAGEQPAYLTELEHTAGPLAGTRVRPTVVQRGRRPRSEPGALRQVGTLVFRFPGLFTAGRRTKVTLDAPDGEAASVLWGGSPAYARRVATFRIRPADAVARALGPGPAWGAQSVPNFVLGRWYHVAADHVIGQAATGGLYVHGDSGEVRRRDDPRVIQFDAFGGDRVVVAARPAR